MQLNEAGVKTFIALLDDQAKRPVHTNPPNPAQLIFPEITPDDLQRMPFQQNKMNKVIQEKAKTYGAITVDLTDATIFTIQANLSSDGLHPNAAGYDKIAQKWFEVLKPDLLK